MSVEAPADVRAPVAPDAGGRGRLVVARSAGGASVVCGAYAVSPLRLLTPRNAGHAAWVFTSSFGGGLVDGDRIALDVDLGAGAAAWLSTQASTKVYRGPRGAQSILRARVGPGALLAVVPDPVVCFAASRYDQDQRIELAEGATLVLLDWVSSGRHGSGERWAFDAYRARQHVRQQDRLVVHDAVALRTEDGPVADRVGRFDVLGTLVLLGGAARPAAEALVARVAAMPAARRAALLVSATPVGDGCLVRFAGESFERVAAWVRDALAFVPALLGDDPWARKW